LLQRRTFCLFVFFVKSLEEVKSKGEQKNGVEKVESFCLLSFVTQPVTQNNSLEEVKSRGDQKYGVEKEVESCIGGGRCQMSNIKCQMSNL